MCGEEGVTEILAARLLPGALSSLLPLLPQVLAASPIRRPPASQAPEGGAFPPAHWPPAGLPAPLDLLRSGLLFLSTVVRSPYLKKYLREALSTEARPEGSRGSHTKPEAINLTLGQVLSLSVPQCSTTGPSIN